MTQHYATYKLQVPECTIVVSMALFNGGRSTGRYRQATFNPHGDLISIGSGSGFQDVSAEELAHKELANFLRERTEE